MNVHDLVALQRRAYDAERSGALLSQDSRAVFIQEYHTRRDTLLKLRQMIIDREHEIEQALYTDLAKSSTESYMTETGIVLSEINFALKRLKKWMRPKRVRGSLSTFPGRNYLYPEPFGLVLILAPWNYPFQLSLLPLIGAIAAGNRCILKPSEHAPATARLLEDMAEHWVKPERAAVLTGGAELSRALLDEKFDYIFFTGGTGIGREVMKKAAEHLTPLTLELGGKSPCIVDAGADLELSAKRIAFGKVINAGQTCVAPDYLLVHEKVKPKLMELIQDNWNQFYGGHPLHSPDWPKIINERHYSRLMKLMENETIYAGGQGDGQKIAPTLLEHVTWDSPIMQEEIFGPILPVLSFNNLDEAVLEINRRERPLACYIFTDKEEQAKALLRAISFGGGCINDTLVHTSNPHLPFGGVGNSGLGSYHGKKSFDTFTHYKSIVYRGKADLPFRYPPFGEHKTNMLKQFLK